jgi:hypothetical protein
MLLLRAYSELNDVTTSLEVIKVLGGVCTGALCLDFFRSHAPSSLYTLARYAETYPELPCSMPLSGGGAPARSQQNRQTCACLLLRTMDIIVTPDVLARMKHALLHDA